MHADDEQWGRVPAGADPAIYDRIRRRVLWCLPTGLYLLGSRRGEDRNLMTLNLAMQVSTHPKQLAVCVEASAHTHDLIASGGVFALSVLRRADRAVVRAFVKPAAWDAAAGTLNDHAVIEASSGAPILAAAASWLDCEVRQRVDCGSHTVFVGEVIDAGEAGVSEAGGTVEVLRMEDTRMSYGG